MEGAVFGTEGDKTAEPVGVDALKLRRSCQRSISLDAGTVGPMSLNRNLPAFCLDFLKRPTQVLLVRLPRASN